ncbi:MAG TPA: hypothetical protein VEH04_15315 [Verrucomicrobiae bacterium]|nr:hypothetical protein [Verrucomicrobiae bacterium]
MIRFLLSRGHGYTLKDVRRARQAPPISVMFYDSLFRSRCVWRGTYVFTDLDRLSYWDLELAAHAYQHLRSAGVPVWNNPARVRSRYPLLRRLHEAGLNDFNVYRGDEPLTDVRFPVFVRKLQGHREPLSDLLHTREELNRVMNDAIGSGTPAANLLVVEFAAEPFRPGLYRKYSAFRIGNQILPHISVHDTSWLVKYGKTGIAGEDLYREELDALRENPHCEHLRKVFDLADIEYGRADFGFFRGRIQVYEINTNPRVVGPGPHPSPARRQSLELVWKLYLDGLRAIDTPRGWPAQLPNGTLQKFRPWKNLLVRTRKSP